MTTRFPGNPLSDPLFDSYALKVSAATIFAVGKAVSQSKVAESTAIGWRTFDIRSNFYDIETRQRKSFILRCLLQIHPRWEKFPLPESDDIVQISGKLIGRAANVDSRYQFLCCRVEDFSILCHTSRNNRPEQQLVTPKAQRGSAFGESASPSFSQLTWSGRAQLAKHAEPHKPSDNLSEVNTQTIPTAPKRQLSLMASKSSTNDKELGARKSKKVKVSLPKNQQSAALKRSSRIR